MKKENKAKKQLQLTNELKDLYQRITELEISKESFQNIVERSADGFIVVDKHGIVCFVNSTAEIIFNRRAEELTGELFGLALLADEPAEINIIRLGGEPGIGEIRTKETVWEGKPCSIIAIRDITERKLAEKELKESEEKLRTIIESINDVIFQISPSGIIKYVSPKVEEIYGYKPEELIGKHLKKTTPVSEIPKALKALKDALSGKTIKNFEIDQKDSKGNTVNMEINIYPVLKEGKIITVQGVMRDIRKRKQTEKELRESEAKNKSLLIAIPDLMFRLAQEGTVLELIPAKEFPLWRPLREFIGKNVHELLGKNIAKKFMQCMKRAIKDGDTQILPYQIFFNGNRHHYEARFVASGKGEILAIVRDFTKQKEAEKMAETDPLTNVYNRRKFSELLDQEMDRVERYNRSLSVILLDLDDFKKINDTYGHDTGDYVLKKISGLIKENIRRVDKLARYGGEEFIILLPETNLKGSMAVAERIRRVIENASLDKVGHITISAGVSAVTEGDSRQSIVKKADRGLYIAKREGKNRISVL
jgi:diguanylate cyclase (GGDEF)-like protein/PAS domain S-box-containing protein